MRVGIAAILLESNTFTAARTTLDDFGRDVLLTGGDINDWFAGGRHEVAGFIEGLTLEQIEVVPLLAARATPWGMIDAPTTEYLIALLDEQLEIAGALDGVLVAAHGATVSESQADFDGYWLSRLRGKLGISAPIIATLDAHANLSSAMVSATNALIGYRTNPHVDQLDRGREAALLMARTLRGEVRPTQAVAMPPMAINIERQCTQEPPCRTLIEFAQETCARAGALSQSIMLGFPYADVAEMGSAAVVVTDNDAALARRLADDIGREMFARRREFLGGFTTIDSALDQAAHLESPVCLLDMGDNVGGGSPGDGTLLAHALRRRRMYNSYVCLYDPHAIEQIKPGMVSATLRLGGKTDAMHGEPIEDTFEVVGMFDGQFEDNKVSHGAFTRFDMGATAVLRSGDGMTFMMTSQRFAPFSAKAFEHCNLDPRQFQVIVAKGVNAPLAAYRSFCQSFIRVDTPGVTSADMRRLEYRHRRRPMYPFESDFTWRNDSGTLMPHV